MGQSSKIKFGERQTDHFPSTAPKDLEHVAEEGELQR